MQPSQVLYDYAMSFAGVLYRWGGDDPTGIDCSGLCIEILQGVGVLPRGFDSTAGGLWNFAAFAREPKPQLGSLVFFGQPAAVTHVGFCLNELLMLEAGGGGSKTLTAEDAAKQNAFVRVRPIRGWRSDVVGFRLPTYPWPLAQTAA